MNGWLTPWLGIASSQGSWAPWGVHSWLSPMGMDIPVSGGTEASTFAKLPPDSQKCESSLVLKRRLHAPGGKMGISGVPGGAAKTVKLKIAGRWCLCGSWGEQAVIKESKLLTNSGMRKVTGELSVALLVPAGFVQNSLVPLSPPAAQLG